MGRSPEVLFVSSLIHNRRYSDAFYSQHMIQIRIVLRDRKSGLYYRDAAEWVTTPYDALTFRNILEAEEFCRMYSLDHLQLIQQGGYFPRPLRYARNMNVQTVDDEYSASNRPSTN